MTQASEESAIEQDVVDAVDSSSIEEVVDEATDEQILEEAMSLYENKVTDDSDPASEDSDGDTDDTDGVHAADDSGDTDERNDDSGDADENKETDDQEKMGEDESSSDSSEGSEEKPKDARVAKRLALISKKEAELRNEKAALKERESAVAVGEKFLDDLKADPFKAMEKHLGEDIYERWTRVILSGKKEEPKTEREIALERRLAELEKAKSEEEEKTTQASQAESDEEALGEYTKSVGLLCKDNDEFELMNAYGDNMYREAAMYAKLHYDKHGVVPDLQESAKAIEEYLRTQAATLAKTKFSKSFTEKPDETPPVVDAKVVEKKNKTLTNNLAATPSANAPAPDEMTEEEIIAEAAALIGDG